MDRIYLIKNPTTWMLDELIVFSQHVHFKVIFIRTPSTFYDARLAQLKNNGIEIIVRPFTIKFNIKKTFFCTKFIVKNILCFFSGYSFVVGIKSIWWFWMFDDRYLTKPASIHAQFATQPALIALLLSKYHSKYHIDYFFTFHAYDIFFNNLWFVKLANNAKGYFSISKYNMNYILSTYKGLDSSKLALSRLGAFPSNVVHLPNARTETFNIGFLSWFVEKKGIKYLLEAMKHIAGESKNIKLTLAGDGPLRKEIEQYIIQHKLSDTILYIGKINPEEKDKFYSKIDALVLPAITLPSDKDGIPVVLMEAISYGLPIISTNISGIPEICINNFNGFLIPEKSTSALVEAINTLYNNEMLAYKFSRNSLQLFEEYNIHKNSLLKLKALDWTS